MDDVERICGLLARITRAILVALEGTRMKVIRDRRPTCAPEQIDAVDENRSLVLADVGGGEGLPDAVGLGNSVGIHHDDVESGAPAPRTYSLIEIRQPHDDGAAPFHLLRLPGHARPDCAAGRVGECARCACYPHSCPKDKWNYFLIAHDRPGVAWRTTTFPRPYL